MPVSETDFRKLALEEPDARWELHCGTLRQKPSMTAAHNHVVARLFRRLTQQLDERRFDVRSNAGHVRRSAEAYYIPDLFVVPMALVRPLLPQQDVLEAYESPLPLVVEIWSRSTGDYDVDSKLPEYQRRGDFESGASTRMSAPSSPGAASRTAATQRRCMLAASCGRRRSPV
jgi:Uma2 family endonuclease